MSGTTVETASDNAASKGHSYDAGVARALTTAGLYLACLAPGVQFAMFHTSTPPYPQPALVVAAFVAHALVWIGAVSRRLPAYTVLVTWSVVAVTIAAQSAMTGVTEPVAARNISMTIAATAALLLSPRKAVLTTVAVTLATFIAVFAAAPALTTVLLYGIVQIPVYSLSVCAALGFALHELHRVARAADTAARARLEVDRAVRRREITAEAARHRARVMHDTVVNTLGAIATARITTADHLVARRCAEDARMVDVLRRPGTSVNPSVRDVFTHAADLDIELASTGIADLVRQLESEKPWRRREIVAALREIVTNVAKHAGVTHATMSYHADSFTVTISDAGAGIADVAPLAAALRQRADDAAAQVQVISDPGDGTTVVLDITPPRDPAAGLFEAASARMSTGIAAVMLAGFAVLVLLFLAFGGQRTPSTVAPLAVMWLTVAAVLALLVRNAGRARVLPLWTVAAAWLGLAAMAAVYGWSGAAHFHCGLQPNLAWSGDAVAAICIVLVLADGRIWAVATAMLVSAVGTVIVLGDTATHCRGFTLGLFATDLLVIVAFGILRRQTKRLAAVVAAGNEDQIRRREDLERLAAREALDNDGFHSTLEFSQRILLAVAGDPGLARDPDTRAAAGLEESYLRALIGLTADIATATVKARFVEAIDTARATGTQLSVHATPGVLDDDSADLVIAAVAPVITACGAGDHVSIGIFGASDDASLILVAPPHSVARYVPTDEWTTVSLELGLIERRWTTEPHCHS